jgi:hypothetical protein
VFSLMSESLFGSKEPSEEGSVHRRGSLSKVQESGLESTASMADLGGQTHSFDRASSGGTKVSALSHKKSLVDMLSIKHEKDSELPSANLMSLTASMKHPQKVTGARYGGKGILDLSQAPFISDRAAVCVITHAKDISTAKLDFNDNVTGATLDALRLTHNFTLRNLSISSSPNIDVRGISALISECGGLRSLSLSRMQDLVTDSLLREISPHLTRLTAIDLSGNVRISDEGIGFISSGCHDITTVKLMVNSLYPYYFEVHL